MNTKVIKRPRAAPFTMEIPCLCGCGRTKMARRDHLKKNKSLFYSVACGHVWRAANPGVSPAIDKKYLEINRECLHCKVPFIIPADESAKRVYCSERCKNQRRNQLHRNSGIPTKTFFFFWCKTKITAVGQGSHLKRL